MESKTVLCSCDCGWLAGGWQKTQRPVLCSHQPSITIDCWLVLILCCMLQYSLPSHTTMKSATAASVSCARSSQPGLSLTNNNGIIPPVDPTKSYNALEHTYVEVLEEVGSWRHTHNYNIKRTCIRHNKYNNTFDGKYYQSCNTFSLQQPLQFCLKYRLVGIELLFMFLYHEHIQNTSISTE